MIMVDSQTHTNSLMKSWHDKEFRNVYQQIPLYGSFLEAIYHKYNELALVKQYVSDWSYSHVGPEMLRYAFWIDKIIRILTKFHADLPTANYIPSEEIIQERDYQGQCAYCKDDLDHRSNTLDCINANTSTPVAYRLKKQLLTESSIRQAKIILIGVLTRCFGRALNSTLSILNLSDTRKRVSYAYYYSLGQKSVLNEKRAKITIFSNYFMHLRQTFSLLPKGLTNPILIEFLLNHTDGTSENIYLQVTGFLSQLLELRKQYKFTIIVLGPIVKGTAKISYEHYLRIYRINHVATKILVYLGMKFLIPVMSMEGLITSQLRNNESSNWTHLPGSKVEPLFNKNGSVTREFVHRWSKVLNKLENATSEVNAEVTAHAAATEI